MRGLPRGRLRLLLGKGENGMEEAGTARRIFAAVTLAAGAAVLLLFLAGTMDFSSRKQYPIPDENLQKCFQECGEAFRSLPPCGVPSSASDVTWRCFRQAPFSHEFTLTLSMVLPENEYRAMKRKVLAEADVQAEDVPKEDMSEAGKGKKRKVTLFPADGSGPKMTIHFDDDRYWTEFVWHFGGNDASDWNMRR